MSSQSNNAPVEAAAIATPIEPEVMKIQIPTGMKPGEAFVVTPRVGKPFTVIVPESAKPGTFIQVTVPEESRVYSGDENEDDVESSSRGCSKIKIQKETAGAALVGGVVGTICLGPIGGLVLAGGAAYCTTRKSGKIGETSRMVGKTTYESVSSAKNWVEKKLSFH